VSLLYFYHLYVYSLFLSVSLPALANKVVHNVADDDDDDRRSTVLISRPLVQSSKTTTPKYSLGLKTQRR